MARYAEGFRTTATSNAVLEIIGASNVQARLVEFGITLNAATLTPVGIGYPAAQGVTPTSPVTVLSEPDNGTTTITTALAWATPPTSPTYFYRRATLPAVIGSDVIWTWPQEQGLLLSASTSIVLWLFATGSAIVGWFVLER